MDENNINFSELIILIKIKQSGQSNSAVRSLFSFSMRSPYLGSFTLLTRIFENIHPINSETDNHFDISLNPELRNSENTNLNTLRHLQHTQDYERMDKCNGHVNGQT